MRVSREGPRGCGHRKPGGLYLVGPPGGMGCGKLPIPLLRCPTCDHGVKPSRSWAWVDLGKLAGEQTCSHLGMATKPCVGCPLDALLHAPELSRVGLLWVGTKYYASPQDWLDEGQHMGFSRRISALPRGFVSGETWVACAHRNHPQVRVSCEAGCQDGQLWEPVGGVVDEVKIGEVTYESTDKVAFMGFCDKCGGKGSKPGPGIFHLWKPSAVERVATGKETEEELARWEKKGVEHVRVVPLDENGQEVEGS